VISSDLYITFSVYYRIQNHDFSFYQTPLRTVSNQVVFVFQLQSLVVSVAFKSSLSQSEAIATFPTD